VLRCCTNARWQRHLPDRGCMQDRPASHMHGSRPVQTFKNSGYLVHRQG
jgi:hypothetical protein